MIDKQTHRQSDGHIISTGPHLSPPYPSLGDKCIVILEPQNVNLFVFINIFGVQRRNALIQFQNGLQTTRQTDINFTKGPRTTGQTDGRTEILYCHSGDLKPWPVASLSALQLRAAQMNFYY